MGIKNDGGYGLIGNIVTYTILNEILKESTQYREQLWKKDGKKYEEYLQYERMINNNGEV